jgi:hypothetical protein
MTNDLADAIDGRGTLLRDMRNAPTRTPDPARSDAPDPARSDAPDLDADPGPRDTPDPAPGGLVRGSALPAQPRLISVQEASQLRLVGLPSPQSLCYLYAALQCLAASPHVQHAALDSSLQDGQLALDAGGQVQIQLSIDPPEQACHRWPLKERQKQRGELPPQPAPELPMLYVGMLSGMDRSIALSGECIYIDPGEKLNIHAVSNGAAPLRGRKLLEAQKEFEERAAERGAERGGSCAAPARELPTAKNKFSPWVLFSQEIHRRDISKHSCQKIGFFGLFLFFGFLVNFLLDPCDL